MVHPIVQMQKEHPEIPEAYGMEFQYINGKKEVFEGSHHIIDKTYQEQALIGVSNYPYFWITTKEDEFVMIPVSSVQSLKFDKRYSKLVAIKQEMREKDASNKRAERKTEDIQPS